MLLVGSTDSDPVFCFAVVEQLPDIIKSRPLS